MIKIIRRTQGENSDGFLEMEDSIMRPIRFVCKAALLVVVGFGSAGGLHTALSAHVLDYGLPKSEEVNGDRSDERQRSGVTRAENSAQFTATGLRCWVGTRKHMCRSNRAANPVLLG